MLVERHIASAPTAGRVGDNAVIRNGRAENAIEIGTTGIAYRAWRRMGAGLKCPGAAASRIQFPQLMVSHDEKVSSDGIGNNVCLLNTDVHRSLRQRRDRTIRVEPPDRASVVVAPAQNRYVVDFAVFQKAMVRRTSAKSCNVGDPTVCCCVINDDFAASSTTVINCQDAVHSGSVEWAIEPIDTVCHSNIS